MGQIQAPLPVLPLLVATSRYPAALEWAEQRWKHQHAGTPVFASPPFDFDQTDYYADTMGTELKKQFFVPQQLVDPDQLAPVKVLTNQWELEYAEQAGWPERRPLNLDPGYVTEDKLVLASTKNHAHRIYVGRGIYAEVTLQFRAGVWQPCHWTYPDYRQPEYHLFLTRCRDELRQLLRQTKSTVWSRELPKE
jgi:hypothetical protein